MEQEKNESLFSYGTLRLEDVQLATFGRKLEGKPDVLVGYRLVMITIEDEDFVTKSGSAEHRNLQFTGNASDFVEGTVFSVTREELERSDAYEPEGYKRVLVQSKSGLNVWIYLNQATHDNMQLSVPVLRRRKMSALPPPPPGFEQLSKADQIRYLQNLWDQISQEPPDLPIPESHLQLVEARLKRYREDPSRAHSAFKIIEDLKNTSR